MSDHSYETYIVPLTLHKSQEDPDINNALAQTAIDICCRVSDCRTRQQSVTEK